VDVTTAEHVADTVATAVSVGDAVRVPVLVDDTVDVAERDAVGVAVAVTLGVAPTESVNVGVSVDVGVVDIETVGEFDGGGVGDEDAVGVRVDEEVAVVVAVIDGDVPELRVAVNCADTEGVLDNETGVDDGDVIPALPPPMTATFEGEFDAVGETTYVCVTVAVALSAPDGDGDDVCVNDPVAVEVRV